MSRRVETILGLTPAFKRIAHYYLCLGQGNYYPENHPHYDHVVVRTLYDFSENPVVPGEYAGGTVVEFFKESRKVKWMEFRCQVTGGGGDDTIKRVK